MKRNKISGIAVCALIGLIPAFTSCHSSKSTVDENTGIAGMTGTTFKTPAITLPAVNDWQKASISGKFRMKGLPVSPSVKIFMEKDKSIYLSLKVPFMGEVGRLEIKDDNILVINKLNKTYVSEDVHEFFKYYPGTLEDLQDVLLARMVIPGFGTLSNVNQEIVNISPNGESFYVMPVKKAKIKGFDYGYVLNTELKPTVLMVSPESNPDVNFIVNYDYNRSGYDIGITVDEGNRKTDCTFDLDSPEWKGEAPNAIKLDNKYSKVSPETFIKSMTKL